MSQIRGILAIQTHARVDALAVVLLPGSVQSGEQQ
jgi:hypothetical protein